jgi:hypothetical protein
MLRSAAALRHCRQKVWPVMMVRGREGGREGGVSEWDESEKDDTPNKQTHIDTHKALHLIHLLFPRYT